MCLKSQLSVNSHGNLNMGAMINYPRSSFLRAFFRKGSPKFFSSGELILGIDPLPDGVYFIDTGYVKVYSIKDTGDELIHIIYGPYEQFPLAWAYLNIESDMYYEALADTLVWRISRERFTLLATTDPIGSYELARQLAQQFQVYSSRIDNLEYKKASERVVYRILFLAARFGVRRGRDILIDMPVTHELVAKTINLARESVSRQFENLEHQRIIENIDHHIIIKDLKRLQSLLSEPSGLKFWGL